MSVPPAVFGVNAPVSPVMLVAVAAPRLGVVSDGLVANTTEPEPVTAVMDVPLIFKLFPVPAVSKALLVRVSVESRLTTVPVP